MPYGAKNSGIMAAKATPIPVSGDTENCPRRHPNLTLPHRGGEWTDARQSVAFGEVPAAVDFRDTVSGISGVRTYRLGPGSAQRIAASVRTNVIPGRGATGARADPVTPRFAPASGGRRRTPTYAAEPLRPIETIRRGRRRTSANLCGKWNGGQGRNRTNDTRIFKRGGRLKSLINQREKPSLQTTRQGLERVRNF